MVKSVTIDKLPTSAKVVNDSDLLIVQSVEDGVTRRITKLELFHELSEDVGDILENGVRSVVPDLDDTYDLGSAQQSWRDLYIDGTLYLTGGVSGTFNISGLSDSDVYQLIDSDYLKGILDSDYIFGASANSFLTLENRIDLDSDRLTILSQFTVGLNAELVALDSDLNVFKIATSSALNQLTARIDLDSDRLTSTASDITTLQSTVSNLDLLAFDSDGVAAMIDSATSIVRSELISRIDITDSNVLILAGDISDLQVQASLLDSAIKVNGSAISELTTRIELDSDRLSVISTDVVDLRADLNNLDLGDSAWILGRIDSATAAAESRLTARIDVTDSAISVLSSDVTTLSADLLLLDSSVAVNGSAISNLATRIDLTDSALSVISTDVVDLRADLSNIGGVDSSVILGIVDSAVAAARSELITRINVTDSSVSVLAADISTLNAELILLDSAITVNGSAISNLSTRVNLDSDRLSAVSNDVVTLNASLSALQLNGIDSDFIIGLVDSATSSAVSQLTARIDADSDSLTLLSSDVTTLRNDLTLLEDSVAASSVAVSNLTSRIDLDSDRLSSLSTSLVSLSNTVSNLQLSGIDSDLVGALIDSAVSNAVTTLTSRIDADSDSLVLVASRVTNLENEVRFDSSNIATSTAYTELVSRIDANGDSIGAVSSRVTNLENEIRFDSSNVATTTAFESLVSRVDADSDKLFLVSGSVSTFQVQLDNLADSVSNTATLTNSFDTRITATENGISDIAAEWYLTTNVNGYVSGVKLTNTGDSSEFVVQTDRFKIVNAAAATDILLLPFNTDLNDKSSNNVLVEPFVNAAIATAKVKYGARSLSVSSGSYVNIDNEGTAGSNLYLSTVSNVTVDFWINIDNVSAGNNYISHGSSTSQTGWVVYFTNTGQVGFQHTNTSGVTSDAGVVSSGTWHHVAWTRENGTTIKVWVDGKLILSIPISSSVSLNGTGVPLVIGKSRSGNISSSRFYLDEFRIASGVVRYTTEFEPPSHGIEFSPFTVSGDTVYMDNVIASKISVGNNLITDVASFEQYGAIGTVPGVSALSVNTITDSVAAVHGKYVLKHVSTANNSYKYLHPSDNNSGATGWIRVDAGSRYIASGYVRTKSPTNITAILAFVLRPYGTNTTTRTDSLPVTLNSSDGWVRVDKLVDAIPSNGTDYGYSFYVRNVSSGVVTYWDAIQLEKYNGFSSEPSPFSVGGTTTIDGGSITTGTISADRIDTSSLVVADDIADFITAGEVDDNVVNPANFNLNKTTTNVGRTTVTGDGVKIESWNGSAFVTRVKLGNLSAL